MSERIIPIQSRAPGNPAAGDKLAESPPPQPQPSAGDARSAWLAEAEARIAEILARCSPAPIPYPVLVKLEALAERLEAALQRLESRP